MLLKKLLEHFMRINESQQLLERYCKLIKRPPGQDENLKSRRIPAVNPLSRLSPVFLLLRSLLFISYCLGHR